MNWRNGGHLLRTHRTTITSPENGVATSVALDADWVVVGLSNTKIHVFSAKTGVLSRTLVGHELGVWAVNLISRGGFLAEDRNCNYGDGAMDDLELGLNGMSLCEDGNSQNSDHRTYRNGLCSGERCGMGKKSDVCCASEGWGQPNALVVSGGCDKVLRGWDVKSGYASHKINKQIHCLWLSDQTLHLCFAGPHVYDPVHKSPA
jgi:F-box and WD-40 domain protein CDC4